MVGVGVYLKYKTDKKKKYKNTCKKGLWDISYLL